MQGVSPLKSNFTSLVLASATFCFALLIVSFAQALPLKNLSLRLVPTHADQSTTQSPKIIELSEQESGIRLQWFSLVKQAVADQDYPTYKVKTDRGVLDVDQFAGKKGFFHPSLWSQGYVNLGESLPLWVAPEFLELSGKDAKPFHLGLLNINTTALQSAPDHLYEQLLYFQNLYDHYVSGDELNGQARITRADQKELKTFLEEFFRIGLLTTTKAKLVVNKQIRNVDVKVLGNRYFELTVLNESGNPLILSLRILAERAPRVFKNNFEFLKKNFDYQVTQVSY